MMDRLLNCLYHGQRLRMMNRLLNCLYDRLRMMDRLGNCLRMEDGLRNSLEDGVGEDSLVSNHRDGRHRPELGGQL